MRVPQLTAVIVVALVAFAPGAGRPAGWIDEDGVVHFEDPPKGSRARKTAPRVELYTTSWCPACEKARKWLRDRQIAFADYDVERDVAAAARKQRLDGSKTIPVAVIDGQVIRGFSPKQYAAALAAR